ncbi:hypothetical protein THAOC_35306, partial [Thalassiosira oceanica]
MTLPLLPSMAFHGIGGAGNPLVTTEAIGASLSDHQRDVAIGLVHRLIHQQRMLCIWPPASYATPAPVAKTADCPCRHQLVVAV